jgi:hypothetical protein
VIRQGTLVRGSSRTPRCGHHRVVASAHENRWDLVDAVSRSPLLGPPQIRPGIDLAAVERRLLVTDELPAAEREHLLEVARELADLYARLG